MGLPIGLIQAAACLFDVSQFPDRTLSYAMHCSAVLCYAVLCSGILCYNILCCTVLYYAWKSKLLLGS